MTCGKYFVAILSSVLLLVPVVAHTQKAPGRPPIAEESLNGKDSFDIHCAMCHGASGRGDGPLARELKTRPADLTTLAQRNGDVFPREAVTSSLTAAGRLFGAHGTTEMPIWGPLFRMFESNARARVRIENLVAYVETLQSPPTAVP
jgi:mono/diheme cytochrome c family protein